MKKFLSLVLVLVLMMSVAVMASAEGTALEGTGSSAAVSGSASMPSVGEMFDAVADFLKLDAFMPYLRAFHTALGDFYIQLDPWIRSLGLVINGFLGSSLGG